jgi:hypothetical protein
MTFTVGQRVRYKTERTDAQYWDASMSGKLGAVAQPGSTGDSTTVQWDDDDYGTMRHYTVNLEAFTDEPRPWQVGDIVTTDPRSNFIPEAQGGTFRLTQVITERQYDRRPRVRGLSTNPMPGANRTDFEWWIYEDSITLVTGADGATPTPPAPAPEPSRRVSFQEAWAAGNTIQFEVSGSISDDIIRVGCKRLDTHEANQYLIDAEPIGRTGLRLTLRGEIKHEDFGLTTYIEWHPSRDSGRMDSYELNSYGRNYQIISRG